MDSYMALLQETLRNDMLETDGTPKAVSDFNIHPQPLWGKCHGSQCCWLYWFILVLFVVVVQSLSHVWPFLTPWTSAHQAFLSFTISWSLLQLMSIESVMPSNHLILCRPLLHLPSIFTTSVNKVMSLLFNTLSRFVIAFLLRSKHLLISWLQSLSAVMTHEQYEKSHRAMWSSLDARNFTLQSHTKFLLD